MAYEVGSNSERLLFEVFGCFSFLFNDDQLVWDLFLVKDNLDTTCAGCANRMTVELDDHVYGMDCGIGWFGSSLRSTMGDRMRCPHNASSPFAYLYNSKLDRMPQLASIGQLARPRVYTIIRIGMYHWQWLLNKKWKTDKWVYIREKWLEKMKRNGFFFSVLYHDYRRSKVERKGKMEKR